MRDSKRDIDLKNRLLDSVGEDEWGMIWENSTETCILLRESIPRQIDKKSRVPKKKGSGPLEVEIGVWNSQGGGKDKLFCLHSLVLVNYTTQFKLCTRDYTTTMYPAWGQFLLPETLLTNPDILECKLWESGRIFLLLNSNLVILKCKLWEWVW